MFFRNISEIRRGGFGIPKLYVKFWWPFFLAKKFTFLFLNLAKINIFIPKSAYGEGGSAVSGNIPIPSLTKIRLERGRLPENLHLHGFPNLVQILIISDEKSNVELYFLLGKLSNFVSAKTL